MKKILVAGSCSFLGVNFIKSSLINKAPYEFIGIDNLENKRSNYNIYLNRHYTFQISDMKHPILERIYDVYKPEQVLYLVGDSYYRYSDSRSKLDCLNNTIELCSKNNLLFNYVCSYKVDKELEDNIWSYDKAKVYFQRKAVDLIKTSGIKYNIIKPCELFGVRQSANNILPQLIKGIDTILSSKGEIVREWMHVSDFINALQLIIDKDVVNKEIEITNSAQLSDLEFCQKVNNILNKDLSNIYFTKLNPSRDYILDNKLIKSIGYTQTGNFISKLTDTISWYQNNKWF